MERYLTPAEREKMRGFFKEGCVLYWDGEGIPDKASELVFQPIVRAQIGKIPLDEIHRRLCEACSFNRTCEVKF